jgi:hypothetical protein
MEGSWNSGRRGVSPRDAAAACECATEALESRASSCPDERERFAGWGLMGLGFDSGHVLGLRRFPVSSIGPGYTSVWHRSPRGEWSFWSTLPAALSCGRYVDGGSADTGGTAIELAWPAPDLLTVMVEDAELAWEVRLASTPATRVLGAVARWLPERIGASRPALRIFGTAAGPLLGVGRLALTGRMPAGQTFHLMPSRLWRVSASRATLRGEDLGTPAALPEQAMLGDFRIPQRGLLAVAAVDFDPPRVA